MPESIVRVALIGYGLAGSVFHAPLIAATDGLSLDAIVTSNQERAAQAQDLYKGVKILGSVDDIWSQSQRYDLVVIASPNSVHEEQARAALNCGLAVVVDKPMAPSAVACKSLMELSRSKGKLLSVFQNRRWDNDFITLRSVIDQGTLGKIVRFESRYERYRSQPRAGSWRESVSREEGGGLLYDLGSHLIDQACTLFGMPTNVYAELGRKRRGAQADDDVFVALTFPADINAHLWMSLVACIQGARFRVLGLDGAFEKFGLDPQEEMLRNGKTPKSEGWGIEPDSSWATLATAQGGIERIESRPGSYEAYYRQIYQALNGQAEVPVDPADAYRTTCIIEAAIASCNEQRPVAIGAASI